ncbi:copper transport protein ATOX1 [Fukomys damarensis]|uniref:copper transport protein ATOX1 n=1 Tax=Fukomys damarensis TaxID=885580 RepID=UPI00053F30AB|nr:copper transport protein ATOX1 [Fukomys damarensis]XP_010638002.1 copper transport protein ATOX1 [Fukomys damarensis]XP_010638003.1 copper transport protein ATOX1 [Fukomys damarensis]XP_010638004.1 copper transport protein ATOX1 [Fukomys damarensis]XP_033617471.1 copper transport protein ATOX1 [Fukomys damarensis]
MPKHEFSVDMTCEGCAEAVSRVLNKLGGVQFNIDLPSKKVSIDSEHSVDTLLATLNKTGKAVSYVGPK